MPAIKHVGHGGASQNCLESHAYVYAETGREKWIHAYWGPRLEPKWLEPKWLQKRILVYTYRYTLFLPSQKKCLPSVNPSTQKARLAKRTPI